MARTVRWHTVAFSWGVWSIQLDRLLSMRPQTSRQHGNAGAPRLAQTAGNGIIVVATCQSY